MEATIQNKTSQEIPKDYLYLHSVLKNCVRACINAGIEAGPKSLMRKHIPSEECSIRDLAGWINQVRIDLCSTAMAYTKLKKNYPHKK